MKHFWKIDKNGCERKKTDNIDDILDKLLDSDCSDLDDDIELGDKSDINSGWEYESEGERVLCGGGVGDTDRVGVLSIGLSDCPLSPGLHPDKWFKIYHTELNF